MWKQINNAEVQQRLNMKRLYQGYAETLIWQLRINPQIPLGLLLGNCCVMDSRKALACWVRDYCFENGLMPGDRDTLSILTKALKKTLDAPHQTD